MDWKNVQRDCTSGSQTAGLSPCPLSQFQNWLDEAERCHATDARTLTMAMIQKNNRPHTYRVGLSKIDKTGLIFNNRQGPGVLLSDYPHKRITLLAFYPGCTRQVRLRGHLSSMSADHMVLTVKMVPVSVEFWQGRAHRRHDRILYALTSLGWTISRLCP